MTATIQPPKPIALDTASIDACVKRDAHGVVISKPDYALAKTNGVVGTYLRRSFPYGNRIVADQDYAVCAEAARAAGLVVGAYPFLDFSLKLGTEKQQIDAFKAGGGTIVPRVDLPPAIDVEGGFKKMGRPISAIAESVHQFVLEIENQLGVQPVIYISYNGYWDLNCPAWPWARDLLAWVKTAYVRAADQPFWAGPVMAPHFGPSSSDPHDYYRAPDPWAETGSFLQQYDGDAVGFPGVSHTDLSYVNVLRQGSKDPFARWIQRRLNKALSGTTGFVALGDDGDFGPKTAAAVRLFKAAHGLSFDDVVDLPTIAALAWS